METTLGWHFNIAPFYINSHNSNTFFKAPNKISAPTNEIITNKFYKNMLQTTHSRDHGMGTAVLGLRRTEDFISVRPPQEQFWMDPM